MHHIRHSQEFLWIWALRRTYVWSPVTHYKQLPICTHKYAFTTLLIKYINWDDLQICTVGCVWVASNYCMCEFLSQMFHIDVTNLKRRVFLFILYVIQHCFICRPQIPLCRRMLGPNPWLLRLYHWQSDAINSRLALIQLIYTTYMYINIFFSFLFKVYGRHSPNKSKDHSKNFKYF